MFVNSFNGFNANRFLPGNQFLPKPHTLNQHPTYNNLTDPSTFTASSLPTYDNSQQFAFPDFQANNLFRPITQGFSGFGNSLLNGLNSGLSGLGQLSPSLPTWLTPRNAVVPPTPTPPPINTYTTRPTAKQIFNNLGQGVMQGLQDFGNMAAQHGPMMLSVGAGLAGAGAICPFMGGTMAATGGIMMAQNHANAS